MLPAVQQATINLVNVSASYVDDFKVLNAISMTFKPARCTLLVGPNGSGKSTALKSIVGLCKILDGTITLNGIDVTGESVREMFIRGVAYVPADSRIFSALSVRENLEVVLATHSATDRIRRIESLFSIFPGVAAKQSASAASLSGGEQQMLSIARAILGGASALLLDEPTSGLSPSVANNVADELVRLNQTAGLLFVIAEHNLRWATRICEEYYALRDGVVVDRGSASNLLSDADKLSRIFL